MFYHFTDTRNLDTIRHYGLLSWFQLVQQGIRHYPGSSPESRYYDRRKGLQDYVRLAFDHTHPMAFVAQKRGSIRHIAWIQVPEEIIDTPGALFSDMNAVCKHATITNNPDTFFNSSDRQAEILIPSHIPAEWLIF